MMSFTLDNTNNSSMKDVDYSQLLAQNKALQSELTQCQADKEFVWSLWKRLQVSNPDVTEAISLVIQREKEKAEAKDHRVLEILQVKDDRIEELQNVVARQSQEISDMLSRKVDLQEKSERLHLESESMHDKLTSLELKLKGHETRERSMDDAYRRTVEDGQREKHALQRQITSLTTELEVAREEKSSVVAKRQDLESTIRNLERDVSEKISRFDGLIRELEETRRRADKAQRQVQQLSHEVDFKNTELESIRKELKELWNSHNQMTEHSAQQAQLIQQLQSLQHDTQIMIKNQEDAFTVETTSMQQMYQDVCSRYETSKLLESELRQQILHLKKELMDKEDTMVKLQEQAQAVQEQLMRTDQAGSFLDTDLAGANRSTLEARRDLTALKQLEKTLDRLDQSMDKDRDVTFDISHTLHSGRHSTPSRGGSDIGDEALAPSRRSRSLSPRRHRLEKGEKRMGLEQRLADTQRLVELKDRELDSIRRAHSRRLDRLRAVQSSEKLLQEQIKTFEERQPRYLDQASRKKKKPQRADPRQLQRENSDAVWNELSYFKSQNRNLEVERLSLQEEVDELRVQASADAATVHELRVSLQAQREEFQYQLKKRENVAMDRGEMENELIKLRSRVQNKDVHIAKLEKDLQETVVDRDGLLDDKKKLKNQVNELHQEVSQGRMQIADLRHALQRQDRALEESLDLRTSLRSREETNPSHKARETTQSHRLAAAGVRPTRRKPFHRTRRPSRSQPTVRRYQRVLNRSIERMSGLFTGFREDGWEEVSESGITENCADWEEDDTEATGDSLGVAIARQARETTPGTDSTDTTPPPVKPRRSTALKTPQRGPPGTQRTPTRSRGQQTRLSPPRVLSPIPSSRAGDSPVTSARERVVLREVATSPIPWSAAQDKAGQLPSRAPRPAVRQLSVLKQRISHLTQQTTEEMGSSVKNLALEKLEYLAVFRAARVVAMRQFSELKAANQQLTADLNQANQRLKTSKLTCQRLSSDVERLQREKQTLDGQLVGRDKEGEKHSDSDKRLLEARLKMSASEVSRQASTIRSLKTEVDTLQDQIRGFQDRINHLERDNNQKRNLVESQRIKLKTVQDANRSHDDAMEELQTKLKLNAESTDKMRIQLDSLKKRMRVVIQEKRDYEDKYLQVSLTLEKKAKEASAARDQRQQMQTALTQMEALSQQQLQRVASHSEAAVDHAQAQMSATHTTLSRYQHFVKLLCSELLDRVVRVRGQLRSAAAAREEEAARSAQDSDTASLRHAQATARHILNISQSDLDDIMSADGDHPAEEVNTQQDGKKDRKWLRKCEKVVASKDDFVQPLISLVLQKVDERADLLMRLTS